MKGVITIAGYGTRFLPASKAIPKEMFPIGDTPLLQHHVEGLVAAGIRDVVVVVRDGGEVAQRHFAPHHDLERHLAQAGKQELLGAVQRLSGLANLVFVRQPATLPYGNAAPALAARPWLSPGEPFYYMFGDDIILADSPVPCQMRQAFEAGQPAAVLATQAVPDGETHLYGCIELKPGTANEVARIVEKPAPGTAPSNSVQVGHFIFTTALFDVLSGSELGRGGELWLADAVARLAGRSKVIAHTIAGQWLAAGDPLRYLKANIELALRRPETREGLLAYLRSLRLGA